MSMEELLQRIKIEAQRKTLEKLGPKKRDTTILLITILSELYSLELLVELLLKTLDELSRRPPERKYK